jgi:hypothetical protein
MYFKKGDMSDRAEQAANMCRKAVLVVQLGIDFWGSPSLVPILWVLGSWVYGGTFIR